MADNLSTFAFVYQDGSTPAVVLSPTTQAVRDQIRQTAAEATGEYRKLVLAIVGGDGLAQLYRLIWPQRRLPWQRPSSSSL